MNVLIPLVTLVLGGISGYFLGRYQAALITKIQELENRDKPTKEKPTITMGAYTPPASNLSEDTKSKVGIVEAKTPELVAWEQEQSVEKQALGR